MRAPRSVSLVVLFVAPFACASEISAQPSRAPADGPALAQAGGEELFPTVDLSGLGERERAAFARIVGDELCPCACPKTFAACLEAGTQCQPAVILGNWLADKLREGLSEEDLAEMITQEVAGGFGAKPSRIDIAGYHAKGSPKAPITIVEYADFECAHCRAAAPVVDRLVNKYPGKVRVVFKHFPLSFHPMAKRAAAAAEAAGEQGRFWEMHDAIFATQNLLDDDLLRGHAKAIGLDIKRFEKDWQAALAKVEASRKEGEALGVQATPTFFVNGRPFHLVRTLDAFEARLRMEEVRATSSCK